MGRRKIEIQPITQERNRSVTFLKRKNGLFKKAYELGVLCSVDVAVIIFERPGNSHATKLYQYSSGDIRQLVQKHVQFKGEKDCRGPSDFGGAARVDDDDSHDEHEGDNEQDAEHDDDEEEEPQPTRKRRKSTRTRKNSSTHSDGMSDEPPPRKKSKESLPPTPASPDMKRKDHTGPPTSRRNRDYSPEDRDTEMYRLPGPPPSHPYPSSSYEALRPPPNYLPPFFNPSLPNYGGSGYPPQHGYSRPPYQRMPYDLPPPPSANGGYPIPGLHHPPPPSSAMDLFSFLGPSDGASLEWPGRSNPGQNRDSNNSNSNSSSGTDWLDYLSAPPPPLQPQLHSNSSLLGRSRGTGPGVSESWERASAEGPGRRHHSDLLALKTGDD